MTFHPASQTPPNRRVSAARLQHGWTQQQLAEALGTDATTISRWERGLQAPSPYYRQRLSHLLGFPEHDLDLASPPAESAPVPALSQQAILDPLMPSLPPAVLGRAEAVAEVKRRLLAGGESSPPLVAITGLPGVGKTALVLMLAADPEVKTCYPDGILWAGLGLNPQPDQILSRWGSLLGLSEAEWTRLEGRPARLAAVRQAIGARRLLLILDDVWQIEDALACKLGGPTCAYLVTTRLRDVAAYLSVQEALELQELSVAESLRVLRVLAPEVVQEASQGATALVEAVGGLPLALTLLGNTLRQQTYTGQPRRILAALDRLSTAQHRLQLSVPPEPAVSGTALLEGRPHSLESVIALTDQCLLPAVREAFYALSVLPAKPNNFSEAAALAVARCSGGQLDRLVDAGLIEGKAGYYRMHQTISDYAALRLTGPALRQAQERLIDYVRAYVQTHQHAYERLEQESSTLLAGLESASALGRWSVLVPVILALVPMFLLCGSYALAERYLQQAQQTTHLLDASLQLSLLQALGKTAQKQGRYKEALDSFQQGLALARTQGNPDLLPAWLADLGWMSWKCGAYAEAQGYVEEPWRCIWTLRWGILLLKRGQTTEAPASRTEGARSCRCLCGIDAFAQQRGWHC